MPEPLESAVPVAKSPRAKPEFWAVVTNPDPSEHRPLIIKESSRKLLEAALAGRSAEDVLWAFRGKVHPLTVQSKVTL